MRTLALLLIAVSTLIPLGRAEGQAATAAALAFGGIEKLLERVEGINLFYGKHIRPDENLAPWTNEFGLELSFHVGDSGKELLPAKPKPVNMCVVADSGASLDRRAQSAAAAGRKDSVPCPTYEPTSLTVKKHVVDGKLVAVDSELVSTPTKPQKDQQFEYDLGFAYGQLSGLSMTTPYEVRGYVRELPAVSLYATATPYWWAPKTDFGKWMRMFGVYVGARVGIVSIQDTQLFVPGDTAVPVVSLSANTFEYGIPFGLTFEPVQGSGVLATTEFAYMTRRFNSLTYSPGKGFPANIPHTLDASGWSLDVGITFPIPKPAK
jgi:hypothetical protein